MNAPAYLAKTTDLSRAEDGSIQIFPPGAQKVTVTNAATGEPVELDLLVQAKTAETLEAARAEMQARADAGEGDAPYFDFNHNDEEASAWPTRIYWAGEDPRTGGVRAEVEWSAAGRAAIEGRTYRRFSPVFHAEEGEIIGAPVNMGGLVNRAAFQRIQPLFAKETTNPQDPEPTTTTMTEEEIAAIQAENESLKNKLTEMQGEMDKMKKLEAESVVEAAAKDGRISTDPALKAKWVASLIADPNAKELLLAMAPNPALVPTKKTTNAPADEGKGEKSPAAVLAKYEELPAAERPAYFAKHRADLIRARDLTLRD